MGSEILFAQQAAKPVCCSPSNRGEGCTFRLMDAVNFFLTRGRDGGDVRVGMMVEVGGVGV